ncbi:DUF2267 domain-containing protein [Rhizomonospora bruguierae]|uniref:DUF2267 domain-containing protein n=1 Tax=Rhizomonospora bruguierae TaxID=1581705 RepID=UPI001BCB36F7|nr:DUF2267 domain-containing protein [Micromonospora sp. NBRC 107566]
MDEAEFLDRVAARAGISRGQAEALARATLRTLAERVSGGEVRDLAGELPPGVGRWLMSERQPPRRFGPDEFAQRVGRRAGIPADRVEERVRAVFLTLDEAISGRRFRQIVARLPKEFWLLAPPVAG